MFDLSAVLVLAVSGGVGLGAMFGANAAGVENSTGVGLVVAGVVAFIFAQQQANAGTRSSILFIPCWVIGMVAAAVGGLTFAIGGTPQFMDKELTPQQQKRLAGVISTLKKYETASTLDAGKMGERAAERIRNQVGGSGRLQKNLRVYLEIDGKDPERVGQAIAWLQSTDADRKQKNRLQQICSVVIQDLEKQFPGAKCKVAIRTPSKWVAHGWAATRGHLRFEHTDWPPDF